MKSVAVKLPEGLLARLDAVSKRQAAGRSSVVRKALRRFLENTEEAAAAGSFAEQAARAAGCFNGPRDLSHASRHMRGYGR
jgi:predicted transcriptional regulator